MVSMAVDPGLAAAVDAVSAGVDSLFEAGVEPANARDAVACIAEFEQMRRRMDAAQMVLLGDIDSRGLFRPDGHGSAKIMMRHVGGLSNGEAAVRQKVARMLTALPLIREAYVAGEIGTDHVRTLAAVFSNPRVRHQMADRQNGFLRQAARPHHEFEQAVRRWERLMDQDGPTPAAERTHENRNARLVQDFNLSWNLDGSYGSMQGAAMAEIFDHYINAETLADWEKARAEHGDTATQDHLPRTGAQRRADALWQIFQDAADNEHGATPVSWVHNILWTNETFEEHLNRLLGGNPQPVDPDLYRCETLNGVPLDPTEAAASAFMSKVRRVVVDAPSTVIDLGEARFFTGNAKHAVKLQNTTCVWPGCCTPTSDCEADHLTEHSKDGRTNPGNGAPLCGKHNRWKQKGFTIWRDPSGQWHTYRPDGTEI